MQMKKKTHDGERKETAERAARAARHVALQEAHGCEVGGVLVIPTPGARWSCCCAACWVSSVVTGVYTIEEIPAHLQARARAKVERMAS